MSCRSLVLQLTTLLYIKPPMIRNSKQFTVGWLPRVADVLSVGVFRRIARGLPSLKNGINIRDSSGPRLMASGWALDGGGWWMVGGGLVVGGLVGEWVGGCWAAHNTDGR